MTIAPGDPVGIRADSSWDVPEAELAVLAGPDRTVRADALGNDMSSRSIEGENPLYLPQAKVYDRSCALGPCLVPANVIADWRQIEISLVIVRGGAEIYADTVRLAAMRRTPSVLLGRLYAATSFPAGVSLLTGASMVPPPDLALQAGDQVTISSPHLGTLPNSVTVVGRAAIP